MRLSGEHRNYLQKSPNFRAGCLEVDKRLAAGGYSPSPEGSDQVFCFELFCEQKWKLPRCVGVIHATVRDLLSIGRLRVKCYRSVFATLAQIHPAAEHAID